MPAPIMTREEVLERITETFRRWGYDGTSLSRLAEATGLVKASLYHYFPKGKPDMARAVLENLSKRFAEQVLAPMETESEPRAKMEAMCEGLVKFYQGGRASCVLELFSLGTAHELFGDPIRNTLIRARDAIARTCADSGDDLATALGKGELAIAVIQGALVAARGLEEPQFFPRTLAKLPELLVD